MSKEFRFKNHAIKFRLLGVETGGFNGKYTDPTLAKKNMELLAQSFEGKSATLMLAECHTRIVEVDRSLQEARGDVFITYTPFHVLMLRPADCLPLLLFSTKSPMLALIHGSRQGLEEGIIQKTLDHLKAKGFAAEDLRAYIGPSIKGTSYLLPKDAANNLTHPMWKHATTPIGENISVDIADFARHELIRLGITSESIEVSDINTAASKDYYSHYRATRFGEPNGRNGLAVAITS